jgi:hypothetical protein
MHGPNSTAILHLERQLVRLDEDLTSRIPTPSERHQIEAKYSRQAALAHQHPTLEERELHSNKAETSR